MTRHGQFQEKIFNKMNKKKNKKKNFEIVCFNNVGIYSPIMGDSEKLSNNLQRDRAHYGQIMYRKLG